jgi:hypothetical protein
MKQNKSGFTAFAANTAVNLPVYILYAAAAGVPLFFTRYTQSSFLLPKEVLSSFLSAALIFAWIIRTRVLGRFELKKSPLVIPII